MVLENMSRKWLPVIREWIVDDVEGKKRLSFFETPENWLKLINNVDRFGWIVKDDDAAIGLIDFEVNGGRGSFVIYLNPLSRGKGHARLLLGKIIEIANEKQLDVLCAGVEPGNESSIRSLRSIGFQEIGMDKDGMLGFELGLR